MDSTLKKRTLKLRNKLTPELSKAFFPLIEELKGIQKVSLKSADTLCIEYDLLKVTLETIEKILRENHITLSDSWMQTFKRGWIHFIEENEAQNLRSVAPSCCSTSKGHS